MLEHNSIPYTVKVSARAKRVTLRIQPGLGLVVSIPKRFPKRDIPDVLAEHDDWIRTTLEEMDSQTPQAYRRWPPETLDLKAIGETWHLNFHASSNRLDGTHLPNVAVHLAEDSTDRVAVAKACAELLKRRARRVLPSWVCHLAAPHGIHVSKISIRGQRTVWGSYSSSGTLSLNYKLLFLPPRYVDYVLLHELAHTRHLDHSPEFWKFLFSMDPQAEHLDATMNEVTQTVPPWLELA